MLRNFLRVLTGFGLLALYRLVIQVSFLLVSETNSIWGEANGAVMGPIILVGGIVAFGYAATAFVHLIDAVGRKDKRQ